MIDWNQVKSLRNDLGHEEFLAVVELFFQENDPVVQKLNHTASAAESQSNFHFLKGTATYLGFSEFAALCARNEDKAISGTLNALDIGETVASYADSKAKFSTSMGLSVG